jgi:hypothetical protein
MNIRTFVAGDEIAQVSLYNEAASDLPRFKPATVDELRRRCQGPDFDPTTRFFAIEGGRPIAYANFQVNGRVSYPWCRKGAEKLAEPLLHHVLTAMKARGLTHAHTAYRADWNGILDFFRRQKFDQEREIVNFSLHLVDLPTPAARAGSGVTPLTPADVPTVLQLGEGVLRYSTQEELEKYLFHNRYFGPESVFALRSRADGVPLAVGILVANNAYAQADQVDPAMPCYRLGAFGTEGEAVKRMNGLFSFLAADRDINPLGLDLMAYAAIKAEDVSAADTLLAQVPADATALHRFYKSHFRRQGSFPELSRTL